MARPLRGGGAKKKLLFLKLGYKKFPQKNVATKLGGGEDKALVAGPLKKELFCGFPDLIQTFSVTYLAPAFLVSAARHGFVQEKNLLSL